MMLEIMGEVLKTLIQEDHEGRPEKKGDHHNEQQCRLKQEIERQRRDQENQCEERLRQCREDYEKRLRKQGTKRKKVGGNMEPEQDDSGPESQRRKGRRKK